MTEQLVFFDTTLWNKMTESIYLEFFPHISKIDIIQIDDYNLSLDDIINRNLTEFTCKECYKAIDYYSDCRNNSNYKCSHCELPLRKTHIGKHHYLAIFIKHPIVRNMNKINS